MMPEAVQRSSLAFSCQKLDAIDRNLTLVMVENEKKAACKPELKAVYNDQ